MKFCLWKNYITWAEGDFLLFFILLSHDCCPFITCSLQYFGFCCISEIGGGVQRHESEGTRTMLPSWSNLVFLLIASPQPYCCSPTAFAKTHKIKGRRLKGLFQRPQPRPYPRMSPSTRSHSFNSENRSWELNRKMWEIHNVLANWATLFPKARAKIPDFKSSQLHTQSLAPSWRHAGTRLWRQMSCRAKGTTKVTGDTFQPQKGFGCSHSANDKII